MFQKIISGILSALMAILSIFGVGGQNNGMTTEEYLRALATELGYVAEDATTEEILRVLDNADIIDNDDNLDLDAAVTPKFVVETIGKAANIEVGKDSEFYKAAIAGGIDILKTGIFNGFATTTENIMKLLEYAKNIANNKDMGEVESTVNYVDGVVETDASYTVAGDAIVFDGDVDLAAGDVFTVPQTSENLEGGIYEAVSVKETAAGTVVETAEVDAEDVLKNIDFKGNVTPNMAAAQVISGDGEVVQNGTVSNEGVIDDVKYAVSSKDAFKESVKDLIVDAVSEGSFKVGDAKVNYAFTDGGFDVAISGNVGNGINIMKSYSVSNLGVQTKFDGSFENGKTDIKEAYLKLDYDCVDTTKVSGSYQASLVSGLDEDISSAEVVDQIKTNFENLKLQSGTASFPVFTAHIAIPNAPSLTIKLEASVIFNIYGYAELIITTSECVGYEIIDNQGRFIRESQETAPKVFNAMGTAEALVGLNVGLCVATISLLDVGVQGGLGVYVYATVTLPYSDYKSTTIEDISTNLLAQAVAITDNADEITVEGTAQFYGIFKVSLCENSISSKIGLSKTWTIVDRSNGTFATINF